MKALFAAHWYLVRGRETKPARLHVRPPVPLDGVTSVTKNDWPRWCSRFDALRDEVLGLHHSRRVWRAVRLMIETNPHVHRAGIAEHWLTQCYSVAQLSGVRRQVDKRKDVVSLWRLRTSWRVSPPLRPAHGSWPSCNRVPSQLPT